MTTSGTAKKKATTKKKPPTKKKAETVHLGFLIDESYSMNPNRESVVQGYNDFVGELKSEEADIRATLGMFDHHGGEDILRVKFAGRKLRNLPLLQLSDYTPRGYTPLRDAVLGLISRMASKAAKGDKVMLVIMTDGQENASEASAEAVHDAITQREKEGWAFLYLGADHNVWDQAGSVGIQNTSTYAYTSSPRGTRSAMRAAGQSVTRFMDSGTTQDYLAAEAVAHAASGGVIPEDDDANVAATSPPPKATPYGNVNDATTKARNLLRGS